MSCSLSVSRLLVASSRMRICGDARIARAMARRCCCPPESLTPRSPMDVSYCSGSRTRSEEHTSELQSRSDLVCRLLLEKKKKEETVVLIQYAGEIAADQDRVSRDAKACVSGT